MERKEGKSLSKDEVFDVLSSSRRRRLLQRLGEAEEPKRLMDLAEEVAAIENDTTVADLTERERKRVYVSLYQTHVPKLEAVGLLTHDSETGLIEATPRARALERYVPRAEDPGPRWLRYYVAIAALAAVLFALVATDLPGSDLASAPFVGVALVAALLVLIVAQFVHARNREETTGDLPVERDL